MEIRPRFSDPGITTKTEALLILSKLREIDQPVVDPNRSIPGFDDAINFTLYKDINKQGYLYSLKDQVSLIGFYYKLNITLQKAISLYGQPQYVLVVHKGEIFAATFINPQKGIAYGYSFANNATKIKPDDEIYGIEFFDPNQYQRYLNYVFGINQLKTNSAINMLIPWRGYGVISQYETLSTP